MIFRALIHGIHALAESIIADLRERDDNRQRRQHDSYCAECDEIFYADESHYSTCSKAWP